MAEIKQLTFSEGIVVTPPTDITVFDVNDLTAKGDLLSVSAAGIKEIVPIGTDGQIATADSTQPSGIKWATPAGLSGQSYEISNLSIACSVAASALTIALKTQNAGDPAAGDPVKVGFRNATVATGDYSQVSITGALSLVISSGSTLGHRDATALPIYVYLLNNAGTAELAASSVRFDEGTVQSSSAEGGAGAADSISTLYSTTARSNVAIRLIGMLTSTQTTAGTWAAVPTTISLNPFTPLPSMVRLGTANGMGSSSTKIRRFTTTILYKGTAITYTDSSTLGAVFTINEPGRYSISHTDALATATRFGVSKNSNQLSTSIGLITQEHRLVADRTAAGDECQSCAWTGDLEVGDVIRAHSNGLGTETSATATVTFTITRID